MALHVSRVVRRDSQFFAVYYLSAVVLALDSVMSRRVGLTYVCKVLFFFIATPKAPSQEKETHIVCDFSPSAQLMKTACVCEKCKQIILR